MQHGCCCFAANTVGHAVQNAFTKLEEVSAFGYAACYLLVPSPATSRGYLREECEAIFEGHDA